jgi:nitrogen fixation NifU-like protein
MPETTTATSTRETFWILDRLFIGKNLWWENLSMYREEVMDHYKRPRNTGKLERGVEAEGENASCGDKVHVYAQVENGEVSDFKHETEGCAICTAATSILSEKAVGMRVDQVSGLDRDWIIDELGIDVSPMRVKCAVLGLRTLQDALKKD